MLKFKHKSADGTRATQTGLYVIERCTDTFVDACLRDEAGRLLMMSVYGRDTAIRELQARIHLGASHQDGLGEMILKPVDIENSVNRLPQRVTVGNAKELDKLTGRLPACVYGNLTHMWLFNPALKAPQKGANVAWVVQALSDQDDIEDRARLLTQRIWSAITHLASIPLLPHWQEPVIRAISQHGMLLTMGERGNDQVHPLLSAPIGNFAVRKVQLDQDRLAAIVTDLVRSQRLTLEPLALVAPIPERQALEEATEATPALPAALEMA
jgi:hypothetical protein